MGLLSYDVYKINVKKLRFLLKTVKKQYFVRRPSSLKDVGYTNTFYGGKFEYNSVYL